MITAEFTVYGNSFVEIDRAARMIARKFLPTPRPELTYSCEQVVSLGRWKAEVTAIWETDEP